MTARSDYEAKVEAAYDKAGADYVKARTSARDEYVKAATIALDAAK